VPGLRIGIVNHCERTVAAAVHFIAGPIEGGNDAVGLPANQIYHSGGRRAEGGAVRVVAHGEKLRVAPETRNRVAVELSHHLTRARACIGRKQVHQSSIERWLFSGVVVVLADVTAWERSSRNGLEAAAPLAALRLGLKVRKALVGRLRSGCWARR
jgi:hypothetical protein